jgi:hypothetical protein
MTLKPRAQYGLLREGLCCVFFVDVSKGTQSSTGNASKTMIKHVIVCATLIIGLAVQSQATTTPLYPDVPPSPTDFSIEGAIYVYFQALANVEVISLSVLGEPFNYSSASYYRWQLFKTTFDWQTPNGNDDRLFYSGQIYFQDIGRGEYTADVGDGTGSIVNSKVLEAGSYYRLSFETVSLDFHSQAVRAFSDLPFTTSDGLFYIFGTSAVAIGPQSSSTFPWFSITTVPISVPIDIDIKPGSDPNSINPKSKEAISVAILTTDTFDATTIDPLSVQFGPNGATEIHNRGHIEDVDGDGDDDMVLHGSIR